MSEISTLSEKVGQRVTIPTLDNATGILCYVGPVDNKSGIWAGIELDEKGQGKNDGSVQGKQYFTCPPNSGIFIAVNKIIIHPPSQPIPRKSNLLTTPRSSSTPRLSSNILTPPRPSKQNLSTARPSKQSLSATTRASKQKLTTPIMNTRPSKQNLIPTMITRPSKQNLTPTTSTARASKQNLSTSTTMSTRPSKQNLSYVATRPSKTLSSRPSQQNLASRPSKQNISIPTRPSVSPTTRTTKHASLTTSNSMPKMANTLRSSPIPNKSPSSPPLQDQSLSSTTTTSVSSSSSVSIPQPGLSPTPPPSQQENHDATNQLYDMLEKIQKERDQLLQDMKNKESAWERLVASKESLSVQVEENESQRLRLSRDLEEAQQQVEQLRLLLTEKEASIAKNVRDGEQQTQDQKRIERLEALVRELQQQVAQCKDTEQQLKRDHAGALEQVRKEVAQSELTSASLEKECEELRRAGLEAIHAYELSVVELKQQHQATLELKEKRMQQLEATIADLRHKQSALFDDDERDGFPQEQQDQRHRLEEQLELSMAELDHERHIIQTMTHEMEQLKAELAQQRQKSLSLEQSLANLQLGFDNEVKDKKRLMEDADGAFESQTKAEDELYQLKLSKKQLEDDYNALVSTNKQLENDYNSLMDDMLVLEKQNMGAGLVTVHNDDSAALQKKIDQLEKENESHRRSLAAEKTQVQLLSKDLADLESLVENRAFNEADMEEKLENEKQKVRDLQRQLDALTKQTDTIYCELCEQPGHDIVHCKTELSKLYCENCDEYGEHDTETCPNQDETF